MRRRQKADEAENRWMIIGGIVALAIVLAPVVWLAGALLSGNIIWHG